MNGEEGKTTEDVNAGNVLAAVDIGSNSIRMSIGQVLPEGRLEVLEQAQRAVHLGQDTFRRLRLGRATIHASVSILKDFKGRIETYAADRVWTVATSAIREARNSDVFVDRVKMAAGLDVDIISSSQEGRLAVLAVRNALGENRDMLGAAAMISEVGGGSTIVTLLRDGRITTAQNLRMGSIRLQEELHTMGVPVERTVELIHNEVDSVLDPVKDMMPLNKVKAYFAMGADARFAAARIGTPCENPSFMTIPRKKFDELVDTLAHRSPEELSAEHDMPFEDAETLVPALMMCQALLHRTRAKQLVVPAVSMRDGLLLELAAQLSGEGEEMYADEVIQSSAAIAEKYCVNMEHARHIADCALWLFDRLSAEHGLGLRERAYLESAALLHEAGMFISPRGYHKHTYYVVSSSEIFGLTRKEVDVVAHIARYHRRSAPKPSHADYMSLDRENRILVNRLSAVLRLAKALDVAGLSDVENLDCSLDDDEFVINAREMSERSLRARSFEIRSDQFEDVFGLKIRLTGG